MIDYIAIHQELLKILQKSQSYHPGQVPVEKEVSRRGTTFTETYWTTPKKTQPKKFVPTKYDDDDDDEVDVAALAATLSEGWKNKKNQPSKHKKYDNSQNQKASVSPQQNGPLYPGSFADIPTSETVLGSDKQGEAKNWADNLSGDHHHAIKEYSGYWYLNINGLNRGTKSKSDLSPMDYSKARRYESLLEDALDKYNLKQDIVVHRQVSHSMLNEFQKSLQSPDKLFVDHGFFSTTVVKNSFYRNGYIDLVIKVPKGKGRGAYIKYLSKYPKENEFLINSHSIFTVDEINKVNNRWQVVLSWKKRLGKTS